MKRFARKLLICLLSAWCALSTMQIPVHAQEEIVNVAQFGIAYADSDFSSGHPASYLNDGDTNSLWIAGAIDTPVSCGIMLDHTYDVESVRVVFEPRNSTEERLLFTASYYDAETGNYIDFWNGESYDAGSGTFADEYVFETPIATSDIRITVTDRIATQAWPAIMEIEIMAEDPYTHVEVENVALNKKVTATGGNDPEYITDGMTSNYWDGGVAPSEFEIDLGSGYFISELKAFPYFNDDRYYHYEIYTSLDGRTYTKAAEKDNDDPAVSSGDSYRFEPELHIRYIRVIMTYNSANPSVHMKEFEAYGYADPNYVEPQPPTADEKDPENIAFRKPAHSHLSDDLVSRVTDGSDFTYWNGQFYPAYVNVDLEETYDLSQIILNFPVREDRYYYYTVYGSNDGSTYDRLYQKRTKDTADEDGDVIDVSGKAYRIIRIYIEYCSDAGSAMLSEVRVHGTPTAENTEALRTGDIEEILGIEPFDESEYAALITEAETIENVYGIIERTTGTQYRDWFTFELAANMQNDNDYYELNMVDGKVHIKGNDGVSLASGVNYYYKNYCHVMISEQANQTKMPEAIVPVEGTIRRETPYKVRYAFNYCTLDYTFAFFDEEAFQKEYDWLALSGVNVVLDLAGQEAVWIRFLMNFGYSFDEAKDWLSGPSYYAWQFMDNLEIFGGPIPDGWITDRLNMARENQRWKRSLGMDTVLQGYAGMVPTNFAEYQDVDILKQGGWCGLDRPDMIRTDGELYDQYAGLFYEAQEWAFGDTTDYYAADPFHEGGIRPSDLSDATISAEVLESLLRYDSDAVWMVQAWWSNPTNDLLKGMGEYRQDHVMILDLTGLEAPKWNSTAYGDTVLESAEFNSTDWVWCMLENYGGNPSMDGQLAKIAHDIPAAYQEAQHMKGIGIISEATYDNPVIYDLIFDMAWTEETQDIDGWLDDYVLRRYGAYSMSAREAWDLLEQTVYHRSGNTAQVMAALPENVGRTSLPYNPQLLERAFELLLEDFDLLSASEAYRYDLTEIMRQMVNNYAVRQYNNVIDAYEAGDLETFRIEKAKFLNAFDVCDLIQGTQQDQLAGEWIGKAEDWAIRYDDFAWDCLTMNAKALITTWAGAASASALPDYAYRNYQGMMIDLYKARWERLLDERERYLIDQDPIETWNQGNYFHFYWQWVMNTPEYTRKADNSPVHIYEVAQRLLSECSVIEELPENEGNLAMNKPIEASREVNSGGSGGGYAMYANDGTLDSYWDGGPWEERPWIIVNLGRSYDIGSVQVCAYASGSRYYQFEVYVSEDGEEWTLIGAKEDEAVETNEGTTFTISAPCMARYVRVIGTFNNQNEAFHIRELRVYGKLTDKTELNESIQAAAVLDSEAYTANSWNALQEALTAAEQISADDSASQEQIDQVASALNAAMDALQAKASESAIQALQNMVDKANALDSDDEALNAAITAAQALLNDSDNASVTAVVSALLDMSEAMQALNTNESVDALRADVQATIDFINENILTNVDNVRPGKVDALEAAVEAAQTLVDDPDASADELKAANKAMTKAAQELWEIVSKAELNALIEAAKEYLDGDYTAESLEALQAAIDAAQAVAGNDDATTAEVTQAITNLSEAIANLEKIMLDTSALEHEIELVTEMIANLDDYVPSSVEGLQEKLDSAKAVLENAASQAEIDEAAKSLREARLNARTKADVSALEELIAYVNSLDLRAYTAESADSVLVLADRALAKMNDPQITQEEVDALAEELQSAIVALQPVSEENVTTPDNGTASDPTNTAAANMSGMMIALMAAAGAAAIAAYRRKRS